VRTAGEADANAGWSTLRWRSTGESDSLRISIWRVEATPGTSIQRSDRSCGNTENRADIVRLPLVYLTSRTARKGPFGVKWQGYGTPAGPCVQRRGRVRW